MKTLQKWTYRVKLSKKSGAYCEKLPVYLGQQRQFPQLYVS